MMSTSTVNVSDVVLGVSKVCRKPLRVLRAFQMAGIFDVELSEEARMLASDSVYDYRDLSEDEIWNEWKSWALYSTKPSAALNLLEETGWLEMFPQLFNMKGTPQNSKTHPEGDVWEHTKHVVDYAVKIAQREEFSASDRIILLFSALLHDVGKPETTILNNSDWTAPKHEIEGEKLTHRFLQQIGAPIEIREEVARLVRYHLSHLTDTLNEDYVKKLGLKLVPAKMSLLFALMEADNSGRPPHPTGLSEKAVRMKQIYENLNIEFVPFITLEMIVKLAKQNQIPYVYSRLYHPQLDRYEPRLHHIEKELTEAQHEGLFNTPSGAVEYLKELLNYGVQFEHLYSAKQARALYLDDHHDEWSALYKLNLTEEEIMTMPKEELEKLRYPTNEE
jgi:putative nucleotidyltransferase with HDIG domain